MKIFTLNNKICDIGIKYLGLGLSKLIKLNYLKLEFSFIFNNKIGDIGIKYLALGLSKLINLYYLKLFLKLQILF